VVDVRPRRTGVEASDAVRRVLNGTFRASYVKASRRVCEVSTDGFTTWRSRSLTCTFTTQERSLPHKFGSSDRSLGLFGPGRTGSVAAEVGHGQGDEGIW
jgi:hypothetical protein